MIGREIGTLTKTPVLTINVLDKRAGEFRDLARAFDVPLYISKMEGFSLPELRLPEGYLRGAEVIKDFIRHVGEHRNYRSFLLWFNRHKLHFIYYISKYYNAYFFIIFTRKRA